MNMRIIISAILICIGYLSNAQDSYHQNLLQDLAENYGITNSEYLFTSTENGNIVTRYNYGNASVENTDIENLSFSKVTTVNVPSAGVNQWDTGMGNRNQLTIDDEDIVLVTFWGRRNSDASELFLFAEDANDFSKEYYISMPLTPDWTQYFVAFKSSKNYAVDQMALGFHFGAAVQNVEIGGFTAMNFKQQYPIEEIPSSFTTFGYEGMEEDALWRVEANERIVTHRMADLNINVTDMNGDPIQGATVEVEQLAHDFGFGSAVVPSRFPGNDATLSIYTDKIMDLDGEGHGFNVAVTENALKWDGWEEEWIGSPEETASAIQWLADRNISTRGHTLIWPGFQYMPNDISANQNDLDYLRNRINERIETMLNHPTIGDLVTEWDVLNEIAVNRDLEGAFMADPNYDTGREVYEEILDYVDAFIMWGFWDGNHWKQNAPMFDLEWNLKPAGEGFIQKVFNDWWTETTTQTTNGIATIRAFKGRHKITVTYAGQEKVVETELNTDEQINIQLEEVVDVDNQLTEKFKISPNPVSDGTLVISFPSNIQGVSATIYTSEGKEAKKIERIESGRSFNVDLTSGIYYINLNSNQGIATKKIVVK